MRLTQEALKKILHYNPDSGVFTRITRTSNSIKNGDVAGGINANGYHTISVESRRYYAHRLAWLYVKGYFPEKLIDHINRNKEDNRFCNLRESSYSCNFQNCGIRTNNTSGVVGVSWDKYRKKWGSHITVDGTNYHLGRFTEKHDAVLSRWKAEIKHGYKNCNSNSTAYLYLKEKNLT